MARKLTPSEFYKEISDKCGKKQEVVKKVYETMVDTLIEELLTYGHTSMPLITETMYLKKQSEFTKVAGKIIKVEKNINKLYVRYTDTFKEQINGLDLSRSKKMENRVLARKIKLEEVELQRAIEIKEKHNIQFAKCIEIKRQKAIQKKIDNKKTRKQKDLEAYQEKIDSGEVLDYGQE